jgi:SGNH domain (fused to AT3 domains)
LRRTYMRLAGLGIDVVVLRALPWVPFDVPSCLSRRAAQLPMSTDCRFAPDRTFMARGRRAQERAARGLPVQFVDMNEQVCGAGPGSCATERDGVIRYTDDNHITRSFSRSLSGTLGEKLATALER